MYPCEEGNGVMEVEKVGKLVKGLYVLIFYWSKK